MDNAKVKRKRFLSLKSLNLLLLILITVVAVIFIGKFGAEDVRTKITSYGIWGPLIIFMLRFTSVIIPALPSTAYSLLSGSLFGFKLGIIIICLSDIISCSICFFISRKFGKDIVRKLVGQKFLKKVDDISKKHLENNFFLMTGFLMTGLFDFVSYAIGLTKTPWIKFAPALFISIILSNPPIVALGAGILTGGKKLLIIALLCIFLLSIVSSKIRKSLPSS